MRGKRGGILSRRGDDFHSILHTRIHLRDAKEQKRNRILYYVLTCTCIRAHVCVQMVVTALAYESANPYLTPPSVRSAPKSDNIRIFIRPCESANTSNGKSAGEIFYRLMVKHI